MSTGSWRNGLRDIVDNVHVRGAADVVAASSTEYWMASRVLEFGWCCWYASSFTATLSFLVSFFFNCSALLRVFRISSTPRFPRFSRFPRVFHVSPRFPCFSACSVSHILAFTLSSVVSWFPVFHTLLSFPLPFYYIINYSQRFYFMWNFWIL